MWQGPMECLGAVGGGPLYCVKVALAGTTGRKCKATQGAARPMV